LVIVAGADEAERTQQASEQVQQASSPEPEPTPPTPGFGERGRMRRRIRFLRKARELAYRDLGGLVFDLHRFGQRNDPLVLAKLAVLRQLDTEVRELERALGERRSVTVLREVGIAACPRCAAIHDSDDRFCPGCGLAFDAHADRPISTAPLAPTVQTPVQTPGPVHAALPSTSTTPAQPASPPAIPSPAQPAAPPLASTTSAATGAPEQQTAAPLAPTPSTPFAAPQTAEGDKQSLEDEPTQILRPRPDR
jgi:hypothetical protein